MEIPLSRFHNTTSLLDQIQTTFTNFPFHILDSKPPSKTQKFSLFNTNIRTTLILIRCSSIKQDLQPRPKPQPKPKPNHLLKHNPHLEKPQSEPPQITKTTSGLCIEILKLVRFRRYEDALELFEILECEGDYDVGGNTYDALVKACIELKSIRGVKRVYNYMLKSGFEADQYMHNRVLLMHVKCGMMIDARRLFDEMPRRNVVSWNTIIVGLVDSGVYEVAFDLFMIMWREVHDAGSRTFVMMIRASAGMGCGYAGRQLHCNALKMGINQDSFVSCGLINMYSKCGNVEDAQYAFDEMPEKTVVGWNSIIAGYALHGYSEEALSMYYEMQDSGVKMDHFTYSIIISICARLASIEHAKQAHAFSLGFWNIPKKFIDCVLVNSVFAQ